MPNWVAGACAVHGNVARVRRERCSCAPDQNEAHRQARSDEPASRQRPTCSTGSSLPQRPAQWASDTTFSWTSEGWLSLAVILDLFARLVVGRATGKHNNMEALLSLMGTHATWVVGDLKVVISRYVEALVDMHKEERLEE